MQSERPQPPPALTIDAQLPNETVRGWAYRILLDNIINLRLEPGTFITEQELADILRASRTPVREALIQLANDGFVDITSQKGTRISLIDAAKVREDRFMRMCIEQRVAAIAAEEIADEWLVRLQSQLELQKLAVGSRDAAGFIALDQEFHRIIFASCGRERMWEVIGKFSGHLIRARMLNIDNNYPDEWERVLKQHDAVAAALKKRNPEAAAKAAERHLSRPGWDVLAMRERFPDYFI